MMRHDENINPLLCTYKLGRSKSPIIRHSQIGLILPYGLTLIHIVPTSDMGFAEDYIHWVYWTWNLNGEWFGGFKQEHIDWFCSLKVIERGQTRNPNWYLHDPAEYRKMRAF